MLTDRNSEKESLGIEMPDEIKQPFTEAADGDARRLLNLLEIAVELAAAKDSNVINEACAREVLSGGVTPMMSRKPMPPVKIIFQIN